MNRRWLIVLATAAALVLIPVVIAARPAGASKLSAAQLADGVRASATVPWSGLVETTGNLQLPDNASFANLAQIIGDSNRLRVWWRAADEWRVDRIRSTGERDLFQNGGRSIRWVFESQSATISPVSTVRLPDAYNVLPPVLARSMLQGARENELSRLPARRIAGIDAPGLRLVPHEEGTTVGRVDLWADPQTGLALQVELYGVTDLLPVLNTTVVDLHRGLPPAATTRFVPGPGIKLAYEDSIDVAAAANAFAAYDLPTSLAGLPSRNGTDPGAVGSYGRGPTTVFVVPLRPQVAGPLRRQLRASPSAQRIQVGTISSVGPIGLLVTPGRFGPLEPGGGFLLAGTVTSEVLERAAGQLLAGP
jgi:hypothetical protein